MMAVRGARHVANLIISNADAYGTEKGREINRYKFSRNTLRDISGRLKITDEFIAEISAEMAERNWVLFLNNEDELCAMDLSATSTWTKLSSKRINGESQ
ncbi:hypothetical protein JT329_gp51 [Klebsiella phage KPN N98]|uniref:Uncharacterized protein n=5 Tax=Yonseivirus N137 TaxID=2845093 RepID=A0A286MMQ3_9CAUD|nr:hypothetical protein HWB25_gp51 [Klebsiella phage KPN N137]YP_009998441.1 hypothetical protein JT329_gp51 [Klebsiella phage KPN N98]ASW27279.1 hypothetical protein KPNN137_51 [Klebsiella phage KPN N137]ASW27513.1 hypothetical protein KPNN54_50 [Klebsiella phage KPN N54]AUV62713.1 hypothetical protein KPNN98_51 [Klebsiella phage KPN N98]